MGFPQSVRIVEVGPRDGLQNEAQIVPTETKIEFIRRLAESGLKTHRGHSLCLAEMGSANGRPRRGFAWTAARRRRQLSGAGAESARLRGSCRGGREEVAVFAAASETFSQRNINCSIAREPRSLCARLCAARARRTFASADMFHARLGCPYEGEIEPD